MRKKIIFFKQKTAYEMRISDWSSDVCSSDLYLLSEHWGCPSVKDYWSNTRSTISLAPVRWLAWNMPNHAEHHANPAVPFHALPAYAAMKIGRASCRERVCQYV